MVKFFSRLLFLSLSVSLAAPLAAAEAPLRRGEALSKPDLLGELERWERDLNSNRQDGPQEDSFERDLQREFVYRLRFQVERRYEGNDASLLRILHFIQDLEEQPGNRSFSLQVDFLRELISAIESAREPSEPLLHFIRQFTENAGIRQPESAEDFSKSRAYLNGRQTETAEPMTDEAWDELTERLNEESSSETETPEPLLPTTPDRILNL